MAGQVEIRILQKALMANHYTRDCPELTPEQEQQLRQWTRRPSTAQGLAWRAQMILLSDKGHSDVAVAKRLGTTRETVGKWRRRFLKQGCEGLLNQPRPGRPRQISDEAVEKVITLTLESLPRGATHWSSRSMARSSGLSQSAVSRIWRAFDLKPHRVETFKLSTDPWFIEKVRDIVGLYWNPPERVVVSCVDEKSQIQALDRTQPLLPMRPGQAERRTHDYKRHGTTSLFAALNVATGEVLGHCYRRHRSLEFKRFLARIDRHVPRDFAIHVILDNYTTHKTALIHQFLLKRPRFHLHCTPTSASWLNLIESWFSQITRKQICRGTFASITQLETAISDYLAVYNENPKPFVWTKTADEILQGVKHYCEPFAKFARKRDLLSGRVVVPGKPMASQVQIPFEGVILQEHSAPISCPTPNFAKGSCDFNYNSVH